VAGVWVGGGHRLEAEMSPDFVPGGTWGTRLAPLGAQVTFIVTTHCVSLRRAQGAGSRLCEVRGGHCFYWVNWWPRRPGQPALG
jgi:hypothetical protein